MLVRSGLRGDSVKAIAPITAMLLALAGTAVVVAPTTARNVRGGPATPKLSSADMSPSGRRPDAG